MKLAPHFGVAPYAVAPAILAGAVYLLALLIFLLTGCPGPAPVLDVHPYCQLPGADCPPLCVGDGCPEVGEMAWCCDYDPNNGCAVVDLLSDCPPASGYAIWCEWGRSIPQSLPGGTAGFECFG